MDKTALSVIIASYNSQDTIVRCLTALENQTTNCQFEIIIVDTSTDGTAAIIRQEFPKIKLYTFSERKYPGAARNYGVMQSSGEILAFTDADCIVETDWIEKLITAHQIHSHPAIGGWAYYFATLTAWMPQVAAFERTDIPTGFLTVKRWAFDLYGPFSNIRYGEDTLFNWKLAQAGYLSMWLPAIKVSHINIDRLDLFLDRQFNHGYNFAKLRIQEQKFSILKRAVYAIAAPPIPFIILYRKIGEALKTGMYQKELIRSLPLTFAGILMWSYGEFLGYLKDRRA
jgi:glycosyltransferase involved in cell wall biosynthesis